MSFVNTSRMLFLSGPETVRDNLHFCLRSAAIRWWTIELSDIDKMAIRGDNSTQLVQ